MYAYVRLRTPDGASHVLLPGDFVGRLDAAALSLDDARISEAHAMVSLRGRELRLLALRGVIALDGQPVREVVLERGQVVQIAPDLGLTVEEVALPDHVLGIEGDALPRQVLSGSNSLRMRPRPSVEGRYRAGADAWIHYTGSAWSLTIPGQPPRRLRPGERFTVAGVALHAVQIALEDAGAPPTELDGGLSAPLTIVARFDTAHLFRGDELALALDGLSARILSELISFGGPVEWGVVAGELWNDLDSPALVRRRWDIGLARLRRRLREAQIRPDLIRCSGRGIVELVLQQGDRVEDAT